MAPLPIVKQRKPSAYMGFRCSYFCSNEIRIIDAFLDAGAAMLLTTKYQTRQNRQELLLPR